MNKYVWRVLIVNNKELVYEETRSKSVSFRYLYFVFKRIFDVFVGFIGILFLIPLALFVKIITICSGDLNSIFFKQKRLGKYGQFIYIYKFRTMVPNAEDVLKRWLEENEDIREEYYQTRKLENDPRITKIGKLLRVTSLDEFPQFINIFKGDMSLIGPRPIVPDEIENYNKAEAKKFLSLRPGLTGYWAVNGRSCTTYKKRKQLELYYVGHCSIWLDIKIIFSTIVKVIKRDGAV